MSPDEPRTPYKPRRPPPRPKGSGEALQPWTAARCQRLLRPLVSRIASLRKDATAALPKTTEDELRQEGSTGFGQPNTSHEWLGPRKRIRLTYSQKRPFRRREESSISGKGTQGLNTTDCIHRGQGRAQVAGELVAATPILKRARGYTVNSSPLFSDSTEKVVQPRSSCGQDPRSKESSKQKDLSQRLAKFRTQSAPSKHGDLEAIYRSLEALLKATRPDTNQTRGPRSLLDLCLRNVPQYIEELDEWERLEAEENGTVSTLDADNASVYIYNYLESFGPNPALGWRPLRVVARADGLKAVKLGISEGLFSDDYSELLIDLCIQVGALPEAKELVEVLLDRDYPQPTSPDSSFAELPSLRPLLVLWNLTDKIGSTAFLLRKYSQLLSSGTLPQDWLVTHDFERVWAAAAKGLSIEKAADDAINFMNHSILLLCRRKRASGGSPEKTRIEKDMAIANGQTLISALTMLAAMSSLGETELQSAHVSNAEVSKIQIIGDRLRLILKSCMADLESSKMTRSRFGNDLLHMALFLSSNNARSDSDFVSRLSNSIEQAWRQNTEFGAARSHATRHHLADIASFVSSVARSCGRGMCLASHDCLDMLFGQLKSLELDQEILDSMKAVAAFSLAQQTNNVKDFIYAERLACSQSLATGDDDCPRSLFTGYRWEETIGEWVMASPVVERRRRPQTRARTSRSSTRLDTDHSESDVRKISTQLQKAIYGDASSVRGLEIESGQVNSEPEISHALRPRHVNTKKRMRPYEDNESGEKDEATLLLTKSGYHSSDDELGSEKENQNHVMDKKSRRSMGRRAILSRPGLSLASQRSNSNSMIGDESSDDELCM
ncbi:uncharacterized protein GGS25DRAFT_477041 [Hypoxylon fragiforme]|uniref:uncharacterized protein n=1 Tax=Hypoxylon fragiforme TaxID=63214 RepID=UPI0020C6A96F|nr:uncharacterized protein GGS25DRAFT_477041 [Hypoxylon fragiforme]KAI2612781.1 hypothetical protein GGS25DRAFT_477041 [Hypoxylon fragiforme]